LIRAYHQRDDAPAGSTWIDGGIADTGGVGAPVKEVSLRIGERESLGLVSESGSGKQCCLWR
jgi:hypothetical protein